MKFITAAFVVFFCSQPFSAHAASCESLFANSSSARTVITQPLMRVLSAKRSTIQKIYLVVDLQQQLTPSRFATFLKREYQLTAKFGTEFAMGLQNVEVVGLTSEISRFLRNPFAQNTVLWAGKSNGKRFVETLEPVHQDLYSPGDSWISNKNRSHLEPYPRSGEPNRDANRDPDRGTPAFIEDHGREPQSDPEF